MSALDHVDHLVLAVPDLGEGMDLVARVAGVQPAVGGRHPNWGTCNAILALGPGTYLEVIAPDPDAQVPADQRPGIFSTGGGPRMIGWFAKCPDLTSVHAAMLASGGQLGDIQSGSRTLPDGRQLRWQLTDPSVMVMDGVFPMLIDWGDSPHPAVSAPAGCRLVDLQLVHPEAESVMSLLDTAGIASPVQMGPVASISARLETPRGVIQLPQAVI
ncbi:MAG: VOC family protein [Phycisphaerales bacterium]|nr:VOC family protein [Phycisphaerales bacterium]